MPESNDPHLLAIPDGAPSKMIAYRFVTSPNYMKIEKILAIINATLYSSLAYLIATDHLFTRYIEISDFSSLLQLAIAVAIAAPSTLALANSSLRDIALMAHATKETVHRATQNITTSFGNIPGMASVIQECDRAMALRHTLERSDRFAYASFGVLGTALLLILTLMSFDSHHKISALQGFLLAAIAWLLIAVPIAVVVWRLLLIQQVKTWFERMDEALDDYAQLNICSRAA